MDNKKNHVIAALQFYGESPLAGKATNKNIAEFLKATTYPGPFEDEVPWCSAFLVWIFKECGIPTNANAAALSWLNFGRQTDQPRLGDIVVLAWPQNPPRNAHVGIFIRETTNLVYVLAGNQNNTVDISPWRKRSVVQYRRV